MKTPTPSIEIPAQENLLQKHKERVERLRQQDRLIKFCIDAGFLTTVGVGQYFMTEDTEKFSQLQILWPVVSTHCQETKNQLTQKVGFEGTLRLDPNWKSQPVTCKVNMEWMEIIIESVNKDNSHSWVRISHGLNKLVTDLTDKEYDDNEQKPLQRRRKYLRLQAEQRLKQNREDLPLLAHLQGLYIFLKEIGLILNQELNSIKSKTEKAFNYLFIFKDYNYFGKNMD